MRCTSILLLLVPLAACSSSGETTPAPSEERPVVPPVAQGESEQSREKPKDADTTLTVGIAAEERVLAYFDHVELVAKVDGAVAASKSWKREEGTKMFPYELVLAAPVTSLSATVEVAIQGFTSPAAVEPINARTIVTRFVPHKAKLAYVLLEERCNTIRGGPPGTGPATPSCDATQTCIGGKCRAPLIETANLLDYFADWADKPPSQCGAGTDMFIEPGTGMDAFVPLADGGTVTLEQGPQCGVHFWLAVRMKNLQQQGTTTTLSATQPGSSLTIPATAYPYTYAADGGTCELYGLRFQLDLAGVKKSDLLGRPLDVTIDLADKLGHKASVLRHVNVAPTATGDYPYCNN